MKIVFFLSIVFSLIACETQKNVSENAEPQPVEVTQNKSLIGKWTLEYIMPIDGKEAKDLFKIQKPYLNFVDENKVAGNNGCNNISGGYMTGENYSINFDTGKFASTRMFCENFDEKAFINSLEKVNRFALTEADNKLLFMTGDIVMMHFVKTEK